MRYRRVVLGALLAVGVFLQPPLGTLATSYASAPEDIDGLVEPKGPPPMVQLSIVASPSEATITLDGAALGCNPCQFSAARDGSEHTVRVSAAGHRSALRHLAYDYDSAMRLTLEK